MKVLKDIFGREVRLTEERLRHILEHPEMASLETALEDTLQKPQLVIQSQSDAAVALHYRFFVGTKVGDKWLCAVVKYEDNDAFVVTAYLTDSIKKGVQVWPTT